MDNIEIYEINHKWDLDKNNPVARMNFKAFIHRLGRATEDVYMLIHQTHLAHVYLLNLLHSQKYIKDNPRSRWPILHINA